MEPIELIPKSPEDKFLGIPYANRHQHLKPIIVQLYMGKYGPTGKGLTVNKIAKFMDVNYSFPATPNQYKNWFRQWNIRKRILGEEKDEVVGALIRRNRPGETSSNVTVGEGDNEKALDKKQLKRYINDQIRHFTVEAVSPGIMSMWNLPYAAYVASIPKRPDQSSPFGTAPITPAYLNIQSPDVSSPSPQAYGPSPTMQLIKTKAIQDKSSLLLQGRHVELLQRCKKEDRVILINYLHDFFMHSFVTAKYWGKGPSSWTWGKISALTLGSLNLPDSPASPRSTGLVTTVSPASMSNLSNDIGLPRTFVDGLST